MFKNEAMQTLTNIEVARIFDDAAEVFDARSNPYAMARRARALAMHVSGRSLEVGGGTAAVTAALKDGSAATHSDIAFQMCRIARKKVGRPSVCLDAEQIPFDDASIATVVSAEMIYYLRRPERFAAEAYRVLKEGGRLVLSTTNPMMAIVDRGRALLRRMGFSRMFIDDGSPKFPALSVVTRILVESGFVVESIRGIVPLPFAFCDGLNRLLECTPVHRLGLFMVIVAKKPRSIGHS